MERHVSSISIEGNLIAIKWKPGAQQPMPVGIEPRVTTYHALDDFIYGDISISLLSTQPVDENNPESVSPDSMFPVIALRLYFGSFPAKEHAFLTPMSCEKVCHDIVKALMEAREACEFEMSFDIPTPHSFEEFMAYSNSTVNSTVNSQQQNAKIHILRPDSITEEE